MIYIENCKFASTSGFVIVGSAEKQNISSWAIQKYAIFYKLQISRWIQNVLLKPFSM